VLDTGAAYALQASAAMPAADQPAGDSVVAVAPGMTPGTPATLAARPVTGRGHLLDGDGTPIARVDAALAVHGQGWAGRLQLAADQPAARQAARYRLRLDTGAGGRLTVRYRDGAEYLVEGVGPFDPPVDG
jgi:hypothetical protein